MSAYTRIRPPRGLPSCLWRALRICRWAATGSLASISGGDGETHWPRRSADISTRSAAPASYTGGRQAERRAGGWCATSVRRHPPTDVVQVSCTTTTRGQELPCGNNSSRVEPEK